MDVTLSLGKIAALLGGWSVILIGISAWLGRILAERVQSQWRRNEQAFLETLRSDLAGNRILLEAAIRSHASGQDLFQQKRVAAVERLWAAVLELGERLSRPVLFFGILLPSEYDSAFQSGSTAAQLITDLTDDTILAAMNAASQVEADRPHLGETLWLQFFIYRAFLGRLAYLITEGKRRRHIPDWRDDGGVRQLLGHFVPQEMVEGLISKGDPTGVNRAVNTLQSLMLKEISLITSGQRSSVESFDNAKQLQAALANEKPHGV